MSDPLAIAALIALFSPAAASVSLGALLWAADPGEAAARRVVLAGLFASLLASAVVFALFLAGHPTGELPLGAWVRVDDYQLPFVLLVDRVAVVFSLLAAGLTTMVGWFSTTYLHKERGFARFFFVLGLFATGAQLVALSGAFDLFFAGWELLGVSSALFIGFYFERPEPVRSSMRAFATYRLCDMAFFLAIVATHELFGSTRMSALDPAHAATLPGWQVNTLAALYLVAALGKSAQLPFSSWLARAMEGPTPASALFYGAISIHAGLYLLLRVWPLIDVAPVVEVAGVVIGLSTAVYASTIARIQTDAKGTLAKATLAQTGVILAEIAAGYTTLALVHLVGHALLRVWQFLRAPNTLNDSHTRGHATPAPAWVESVLPTWVTTRVYAEALHRFRLDDVVDAAIAPVTSLARGLDAVDARFRGELPSPTEGPPTHRFAPDLAVAIPAIAAMIVSSPAVALGLGAASLAVQAIGLPTIGAVTVSAAAIAAAVAAGTVHAAPTIAFVASIASLALRTGVMPLHPGIAAAATRRPGRLIGLTATATVGVYLHLRHVIPAAPAVADAAAVGLVLWGAVAALIAAILSLVQRDLRGLWSTSMTMHAGMLLAAVAAAGRGYTVAPIVVSVTLTLALGGFGLVVRSLEARTGAIRFDVGGGRVRSFPRFAAAFAFFAAAGIALPGTAGYIADDLLLHALWAESPLGCALIIAASATLAIGLYRGFAAVFLGHEARPSVAPDARPLERALLATAALALVILGLVPMALVGPAGRALP